MVTYMQCKRCGKKGCHVEENRRQGMIKNRQKWCRCQEKKEEIVMRPREAKAQQSGI